MDSIAEYGCCEIPCFDFWGGFGGGAGGLGDVSWNHGACNFGGDDEERTLSCQSSALHGPRYDLIKRDLGVLLKTFINVIRAPFCDVIVLLFAKSRSFAMTKGKIRLRKP